MASISKRLVQRLVHNFVILQRSQIDHLYLSGDELLNELKLTNAQ